MNIDHVWWSNDCKTVDDTWGEVVHAVLLTVGSFTGTNHNSGRTIPRSAKERMLGECLCT